jgi:hypothetical protein
LSAAIRGKLKRVKMRSRVYWSGALLVLLIALAGGAAEAAQIAYYNCNAGSGNTLIDNTGNGHTAYLYNGVTWVNDPWGGKALAFSGGNDQPYAMVTGAQLTGLDAIEPHGAIEFWYYRPPGAEYGSYIGFNSGANWYDERLCVLSWSPPNYRDLGTVSYGTSTCFLWGSYNTSTQGQWTHIVLTWNGTNAYLVTNGNLSQSGAASAPDITGIPLWIGRSYGVGNQYYTGYLDEISLWDNFMTATEARNRYNAKIATIKGSIEGHVDLQDVNSFFDPSKVGVEVQLRPPGSTTPTSTFNTVLDPYGWFVLSQITPGTYDVAIKASGWLRKVVPNVVVGAKGAVASVDVSLKNGDLDGNNEVSSSDLSVALTNTATTVTPPLVPIVVTGTSPTACESYAAQEMATYLGKILGKDIQVVTDANVPSGMLTVAVGLSTLTSSMNISSLDCEQYITDIQSSNNLVRIRGGNRSQALGQPARETGTLYGVYDFLEKLGVRWYRPEDWGEYVPKLASIPLTTGTTTSTKPSYFVRGMLQCGMSYTREETPAMSRQAAIWGARNRTNLGLTGDPTLIAQFGGLEKYGWEGGWPVYVPKSLFATHPEYFALIGGVRNTTDLCVGNLDVQNIYATNVIAAADADPYMTSFALEPDDGRGGMCECPLCKAMDLPTNTRDGGTASNRVAKFAAIVADKVHAVKPYVKIMWLAYSSHTAAPTNMTSLRPNSIIMPAPINGWDDWRKNLLDGSSPHNSGFVTMVGQWAALSPSTMMVYEYYGGYGWPGPVPITNTIADRMKNYRGLGIKGIHDTSEFSWGPEAMDIYMAARLAWNPDLDVTAELNLYYSNYYGPAAAPMKLYHEALMNALASAPYIVCSGARGMYLIFKPSLIATLGNYMSQAQALVSGNDVYEKRLYGVWAGYEFARRVSNLQVLKKATGVLTATGEGGYYYQSAQAEAAYTDLLNWMQTVNTADPVFDMSVSGTPWFPYLREDLLYNAFFGYLSEQTLLANY